MAIENIAVTELELLILQQIWEQGNEATVNLIWEIGQRRNALDIPPF